MASQREGGSGPLGTGLVNPYRQDTGPSRRRGRRSAVAGAGAAVAATAAVVSGLGATAAHAGPNAEAGASIARAAGDASLNDGAVGGVVVRELRSLGGCVVADGLAAIGSEARRLVAEAGGQPGLVQLTKDLASYVDAGSACVPGFYVPDGISDVLAEEEQFWAEQEQRWAEQLAARLRLWDEQERLMAEHQAQRERFWAEQARLRAPSAEGLDPGLLSRTGPS